MQPWNNYHEKLTSILKHVEHCLQWDDEQDRILHAVLCITPVTEKLRLAKSHMAL